MSDSIFQQASIIVRFSPEGYTNVSFLNRLTSVLVFPNRFFKTYGFGSISIIQNTLNVILNWIKIGFKPFGIFCNEAPEQILEGA